MVQKSTGDTEIFIITERKNIEMIAKLRYIK